ncbi:uncharacterized protein LOC125762832 [Anopheles funestus]|uniref:uncharacterized protein LOC125762832 n=1 Tax=Anopheles funestus TaxID=62324 RepID=UPI0020C68BAE|nr:uncharacterized protein LOC125762832 [Anopheles funestus]
MYKTFHKDPTSSIAEAFQRGYEVVYDLDNKMEILHWNNFSRQTITIDPHNIIVPDEMRDLHGYKLNLYLMGYMRKTMTFDKYFLEQIAEKVNATAVPTDVASHGITIIPLLGGFRIDGTETLPGLGTTFWALAVPRAKPKSVVSILIDPFDMYTWITYFILVLTMAIQLVFFGEFLGRRHFVEIVLELIMISIAGPSRTYGGSFENRIITMFCLMGIVLISSYQSLVISFMSFVRYHPEINTLAEIEERCLFVDNNDARLFNFKTFPNGTFPGFDQVCTFEIGRDNVQRTLMLFSNYEHDRRLFFNEDAMRYKVKNFRYANTKFFEQQLLYYVSPRALQLFKFHFQAIFESGIYDHYYNNKSLTVSYYAQDTFVDRVVKVGDLTLLWYAYAGGTLLSVACFVIEQFIHNKFEGLSAEK